jgi:hypothetical protein
LITDTGASFGHFVVPLADGEVRVVDCIPRLHARLMPIHQVPQRMISLGDMHFLAILSDCSIGSSSGSSSTGNGNHHRLRIMSTENFSRSRSILCKTMSGLQIISQYHTCLRAPLALLQAQRAAFDEGFITPLRELQSIIARNGFTHTAEAEFVTYAAHEVASPCLSQWLEAHLRDTGVKRLQRCVASLRDAGTHACSSLSVITSNIIYVLTEMRAWAAGGDYVAIGLQPQLLTAAVEQGILLLQQLEQLQNALTLHCSGARALALWISNAFKLLADPSTHAPDFPVAVCREALHFVHARLWCKDVLDVMGSGSGSSDSSSNSGGSRNFFNSTTHAAAPLTPSSAAAAPSQHILISTSCDALKAACTACSAAVGQAIIASIRPAFVTDLPHCGVGGGGDVYAVHAEGQELGITMLSLGGGVSAATAAPTHSVEFTRVVVAAEAGWRLEHAQASVALKVSDVLCEM